MNNRVLVKKVLETVTAPLFRLNLHILKRTKFYTFYMRQILAIYEGVVPEYISMIRRPKTADKVVSIEKTNEILQSTAIIMQGPLVYEEDFTLETVKLYGKIFPGTLVIVSTWSNEKKSTLERLTQLSNCRVIASEYPQYSGFIHLNYQIVSTMAGLRLAKDLGKEYAFKTRTDFRFSRMGCIEFMYGLLQDYPVDRSIAYQRQRIILAGGIKGSMFHAFWPGDQYAFGYIEDMLNYWNYDLDQINLNRTEISAMYKKNKFTQKQAEESGKSPEVAIQLNYYMRMERKKIEFTLAKYWERLRQQYIILSREDLGVYWPKYSARYDETERVGTYYSDDSQEKCLAYNWNFIRWYNLYKGNFPFYKEYEEIREKKQYR